MHGQYESEFICNCGHLLYSDVKTKENFCLNNACDRFIDETIKNDSTIAEKALEKEMQKYLLEVKNYDRDSLLTYLNKIREELIIGLILKQSMDIRRFYGISELIRISSNNKITGRDKNENKFAILVTKFTEFNDTRNFLEEVKNKRYVLTDKNRVLILKYAEAFQDMFSNYGITNMQRVKTDRTFQYAHIDQNNIFNDEYKEGMDMIIYFKRFYRLMITLNYLLKYHHTQSKTYSYAYNKQDIAFLLSLFYSMKENFVEISYTNMKRHLTLNSEDAQKHSEFLSRCVDAPDKVPIIVRKKNTYSLGKFTILFYMLYLIGLESKKILQEGKEVSSNVFEEHIREKLRKKGYTVPFDEGFTLSKKSFEYDVIGISDEKKEILLIEAKYQDFAPSSWNGLTLLDQELHSEKGLLEMAKTHQERLEYFKNNKTKFNQRLNIKQMEDYAIRAIMVTKYVPLLTKYAEIDICSLDQFFSRLD